jgi:hypothetical protein
MTDWPSLSRAPAVEGYRRGPDTDTTVRDRGPGRPLSRPGCEPILDTIEFTLRKLSDADVTTLNTFQRDTVQIGGVPFNFTDPVLDDSLVVTLAKPMVFELDGEPTTWWTSVKLYEEPAY